MPRGKSVFKPRIYKPKLRLDKNTQFDRHFRFYKLSKKTFVGMAKKVFH